MWWGVLGAFILGLAYFLPSEPAPLQASVIIEDYSGHGSGVFISPTQILTARHVAAHAKGYLRARGPDGDIYHIVEVSNGPADIAILTVDRPLRGVPLKTSCEPLERGEKLTYIGSPLNIEFAGPMELIVMGGKGVSGIDDPGFAVMSEFTLLTNGEAEPGVSGAGVINSSGRVVGIYNFAWGSTTFGGFVSLSYPAICEFVMRELQPGANA
jgi:S1-C subfamily serine protease